MRLSAIYIEEHDFLFDQPQALNLGGKCLYKFSKQAGKIIVTRTENKNYIHDFFSLTDTVSKILSLNAIVGQNGSGKSTLLDIIRSRFVKHEYAFPQLNCILLFESDLIAEPSILKNGFGKVYLKSDDSSGLKELKESEVSVQSIYYSPHFDYKYNPNFDDADSFDISFEKSIELDLDRSMGKNANENGIPYSVSQELLFKNSLRQIQFLNSDLVKTKKIFSNIFHLQQHYEPILHFRGYNLEQEWNTPYQFRGILKLISEKASDEISKWHEIRVIESDKVLNQIEIDKYILKRNIIKSIVSLLYKQMEKKNSFLQEGFFPYEDLKTRLDTADAEQSLLIFTDYSTIKFGESTNIQVFDQGNLKKLLHAINDAIDNVKSEYSVTSSTLKSSTNDAIKILQLQRAFVNDLNGYYNKFYSENLFPDDGERVDGFIDYMPFSRRMSSGESALLNFYSKLYDFLDSNLKEPKFRRPKQNYLLLLDEADLTFHITWKKRYVKALLRTIPYFFDELDNQPSIQIIFTTHDPITLSDIPNSHVVYLERPDYDSPSVILDYDSKRRPKNTFGANISDLIADSFFMEDSLIGDFAFDKIREVINWLNDPKDLNKIDYYETLIKIIDEPIVQRKLAEMFDEKTKKNVQIDILDQQIAKLESLRQKLT